MNVHMIEDIIKCRDSLSYFIEKYCGIELSVGQREFIKRLESSGRIETFLSEEERTPIMICLYAHEVVFKTNVTLCISAFNVTRAQLHLEKVRKMIARLPDHLRPIIEINNKRELKYDNRNLVIVRSMKPISFRGMGINIIWIDALYSSLKTLKELEEFLLPVVSSGRGQKYIVTY